MQKLQRMIFNYKNKNNPSLEKVWAKFNYVVNHK
jgi:hypothetical protein